MAEQGKTAGVHVELEDLLNIQSRLGGLSIRHLHRFKSISKGISPLRRRGTGMEYEESRAYVVGDDARTMDWRVMARTGEAHTKIYTDERDPGLLLLVDLSSSMFFGTDFAFKSWSAVHLAAHLAWLAYFDRNRLSLLVASPQHSGEVTAIGTRQGLIALLMQLVSACRQSFPVTPQPGLLNPLLARAHESLASGTDIVLISDFLGIDSRTSTLLQSFGKNRRITAYWVHDRSEVDDWPRGPYALTVNNQAVFIDTRDSSSEKWLRAEQRHHRRRIDGLTREFSIRLQPISCNRDVSSQLLADQQD